MFFNAPFSITWHIRSGSLDQLLIRPVGPLFQIIGLSQEMNGLGSAITALGILGYAAYHLNMVWTAGGLIYIGIALLSSMLIQLAVLLAIMITAFWILEIRSVIYPLVWLYDFSRYPMDIFGPLVRGLLTYVVPYALGTFYSAAYLLRPTEYPWVAWVVPLAAVLLSLCTYRLWLFGLKKYTSVSS